ncbi:hypothetical protein AVEN_158233-1 [Araneus ventricosus]|uniref:CCHC-type domain-containing protein n=1 Tax=Araneus ventricosus TaxID=182803 RepID=A0A4Y2FM23_ARAVE|nr:hypothetical protein AVEN_158233-1 [Araneus ventricosus]
MPRAGGCHPLLGSVVGDAVEPESLPMSYGFFVSRRRSQFIYSLHVDQHSKHFSYEAEFLEELRDQNVCAARRINIRRDDRLIPTQHVVLTFQSPVLRKSIKEGYINCKLRPYIPNPLRCFKCHRYGHSQQSCRGTDPVCELTCMTSDHFPIFLDRVNVGSNNAQRPTRYLFHRADWTNFTLRALITRDMVEGENLNEVVNLVTKTNSAADASIPKSGLNFPKNRKPW